jgi:Ca2+-binding EF-hand superfamily protein
MYDENEDGHLQTSEFIEMCTDVMSNSWLVKKGVTGIKKFMKSLDQNNDDKISISELRQAFD